MTRRGIIVALAAMLVGASGVAADAQFRGGPHIPGNGASPARRMTLDSRSPIAGNVTSTIVTFSSAPAEGVPKSMRGRFNVPKATTGKIPAVVYVHGTAGVDGRGAFNAFALNEAGIATLEIDMWEAAGLKPSQNNRVRLVDREQYAYGALQFLAAQPQIDASRIGIEGESMGGGVTLQAATRRAQQTHAGGAFTFAAYLSFYPDCSTLAKAQWGPFTGGPMRILVGDLDTDSPLDDCQALAAKIGADITVFPGGTHQWDTQLGPETFFDPLADHGAGGMVNVVPSAQIAETSRRFGAQFFRTAFGMP